MKKFYGGLLAAAFLGFGTVQAQTLQANKTQLAFGNATEIAPVTQQVVISNPLNYSVNVTGIRFFTTYGAPAFSVNQTLPLSIPAGGSQTLTVTFSPLHNIAHNSEMVIETDSHGGHLSVDLTGQGKYSKSYYNNSENKSEEQLKVALKGIVSNPYTSFSYDAARDKMYMEVDNWKTNGRGASVNTLECVYTGRVAAGYTSRSNIFSNFNINAEHTFPQGKFGSSSPMVSDMHHLFPTDEAANNSRSSYPFGIATTPYRNDQINTPSHLGNNNLYEPRDQQKGATARAMLYFVIRYQDYQGFFVPQEAILKTWNKQFAPTPIDVKRNNDIQARQQNRNPFVDYPQLADRINNFVSPSAALPSYELYQTPVVNYGHIPAGNFTYNYVLVNNGNQTMNFTNPTLSNTSILSFASGSGSNFSIAPGEAYTLKINLNLGSANDSVSEMLTLGSNIPGKTSLSVPVYANKNKVSGPLSAGKNVDAAIFNLFPNPVGEELTIARGNQFGKGAYNLEILDAMGRTVRKTTASGDISTVNVTELKRGAYFIRINSGNEVVIRKFIKL
ncbi:endonuclease [Adhaeribacter soli]|uniref:Choice-of-anchor D domain-containing protein n=1 Tax=Adhaeribacter soli TaxID=2607655 RepID=A0A5N1IGZ4_9BACT|nr:endonuclease [Adhaeribacter soli]KAA9324925.1 choice-of-anchor D domain-containing protein [Adhaeribacter soli]